MTCASCANRDRDASSTRLDGVDRHGQLRHREGQRRLHAAASTPTTCSPPSSRPATPPTLPAPQDADGPDAPTSATTRPARLRSRAGRLAAADRAGDRCWRWSRRCSSTYWQWLSLTLAAPVVVWGGLPFHRAAWTNLRHGASTMDTLVSIGTLAAFGWSLYALFLGHARRAGHAHAFDLTVAPRRRHREHLPRGRGRASPPSCSRAATSRPGPSAGPAPRCAPC